MDDATRRRTPLRMYGVPSEHEPLPWSWVEERLATAATFWLVARSPGHPHPRPVWGVWFAGRLHLSVGSPALLRAVSADPAVTVHPGSGLDVVIVEGTADLTAPTTSDVLAAYDAKYDWSYDLPRYGDLVVVTPVTVLAWRAAGPAGRDGFAATGRWSVDEP